MGELIVDNNDIDQNSAAARELKAKAEPATPPSNDPPPATPPAGDPPPPPAPPKPADPPAPPTPTPPTPPAQNDPPPPAPATLSRDEIEAEVYKDLFGDKVPTKEEAKKIIAEFPTLAKRVEELQSKKVTFANSYIEGLNDYISKGGTKEAYDRVQSLDLEKLTPEESIKALYKWNHPELTERQIEILLNKKFSIGDGYSDEDKELGQVELTIEAKKSKDELAKLKVEQSIPEPERLRVQEEEAETQRMQSWTPTVQKLVSDFNNFDVPLAIDEKGNVTDTLKYAGITPEVKNALLGDLRNIIEVAGIPHTPEEIQAIQNVMQERFILRNFKAITTAMATEMKTRAEQAARKEYYNGNPPPAGDAPPTPSKGDNSDEIYQKMLNQ